MTEQQRINLPGDVGIGRKESAPAPVPARASPYVDSTKPFRLARSAEADYELSRALADFGRKVMA